MTIFEVTTNKKQYLPLLLLGDEQESMIDCYLSHGRMFAASDGQDILAECVVTDEGNGVLELKNIAVAPSAQRKGIGRMLIEFLCEQFRNDYTVLHVGTGDSPLTIPFYESCGFTRFRVIPDFFLLHYDHPIFEGGVQLKDMICLRKFL